MRRAYGPSVDGLLMVMQEATKALQRRSASKSLSIVNISSTTSSIAMAELAAYSSAKAAIRQLSKSAALEYAPLQVRWEHHAALCCPVLRMCQLRVHEVTGRGSQPDCRCCFWCNGMAKPRGTCMLVNQHASYHSLQSASIFATEHGCHPKAW